ncbi:MAG: M28 family peptidase [Akkermansiaceae bacterium]
MRLNLSPIILCSLLSLFAVSCKKSSPLPPQATGQGTDSSKVVAHNDVAKQVISPYKNWSFGVKAYLHTKHLLDFGPRPIESEGHKKSQAYITSQLEKFGWTVSRQSFKTMTPYGDRSFVNIIARYNEANKSPNIVLGAHYDSKQMNDFLGADDAASCVGALLEIAEHLPAHEKTIAQQVELVFFDGEEALSPNLEYMKDGLYGSIYYSQYLRNDIAGTKKTYLHKPKFGMILDMIGHRNLSIKIPNDTPYQLLKSYYTVVEKHQLQDRFTVSNGSILDDHYPMNMIADLPTIDLIGDFSSKTWWHTNKDNFDNISENSLNVSIQVALEIIKDQLTKIDK